MELDTLSDSDKVFFTEAVILWLYEYRKNEGRRMRRIWLIGGFVVAVATALATAERSERVSKSLVDEKGCLTCHEGIERFTDGPMQETIEAMGETYGDPGGCVICHRGGPAATMAKSAHDGAPEELMESGGPQMFYPDPGSVWIAENTCGQCHEGYASRLIKALMNTEAGKLQGTL